MVFLVVMRLRHDHSVGEREGEAAEYQAVKEGNDGQHEGPTNAASALL